MKRTQHLLAEEQHKKLVQLAEATGLTTSEHIRRAIDFYLDKQEQKKN